MKVAVHYKEYNTGIENASIELDSDKSYNFTVIEDDTSTPTIKKLQIKATDLSDPTTPIEIPLEMTLAEAKQLNLLLTQFLRQL